MNFLVHCHGYAPTHNAGAEYYLHSMMRSMVGRGHRVYVLTRPGMIGSFTGNFEGVDVKTNPTELETAGAYEAAHVVITHLDFTRQVIDLCKKYDRPLMYVVHNEFSLTQWKVQPSEVTTVIFNSNWLAAKIGAAWQGKSAVVPPVVWFEDYAVSKTGDAVTLCNLNLNKGGDIFWHCARQLPHIRFIGVRGYGKQIIYSEKNRQKNIEIWDNQPDIRTVFTETKLLLMPSQYETWGRVAMEAACSGIPTVANKTAGLFEAMGDGAIWVERRPGIPDDPIWPGIIREMMDNPEFYDQARMNALSTAKAHKNVEFVNTFEVESQKAVTVHAAMPRRTATPHFEVLWSDKDAGDVKNTFVVMISRAWAVDPWFNAFLRLDLPRTLQLIVLIDSADFTLYNQVEKRLREVSVQCENIQECLLHFTMQRTLPEKHMIPRRARIVQNWKTVLPRVKGRWLFGGEDDTLPPPHAYRRLRQVIDQTGAAFAQGVELGRWAACVIPNWEVQTDHNGQPIRISSGEWPPPPSNVVSIRGGGWYCFAADVDVFRATPMRWTTELPMGPDMAHVFEMTQRGELAVGVCDVKCTHFGVGPAPLFADVVNGVWRLHPDQPGKQQLITWKNSAGKWETSVIHFKRGQQRDELMPYDENLKHSKNEPRNVKVKALHTWLGEEGHIARGQVLFICARRRKFLEAKGWVYVLEDPKPAASPGNAGVAAPNTLEGGNLEAIRKLREQTGGKFTSEQFLQAFNAPKDSSDPQEAAVVGPEEGAPLGPSEGKPFGPQETPAMRPEPKEAPAPKLPDPPQPQTAAERTDAQVQQAAADARADVENETTMVDPDGELCKKCNRKFKDLAAHQRRMHSEGK